LGSGWQAEEVALAREVWVIDDKDNVGPVISHGVELGTTAKEEAGRKPWR
jgi:hypothetical protein